MNNWQTKKLGEIVGVDSGAWGPVDNSGTAVLRSTNFTNEGKMMLDNVAYRSIPEDKISKLSLEKGDILLEKSGGGPSQPVGRVIFFDRNQSEKVIFGNFISRLRPQDINNKYLFYYLLFIYKRGDTNRLQNQTTGIRNLILKKYLDTKVPVPAKIIQHQIVERLDAIRKLQELNQQEIEKVEELLNSLLIDSFKSHDEWGKKILPEVAKVMRGKFTPRPRNDPKYFGGKIPWIQTGDITNSSGIINSFSQTLNDRGLAVSRLFSKGTIVITIAANIGDLAILGIDAAFPDSVVGIIADSNVIDKFFLFYQLKLLKKYFNQQATQAAQKNINLKVLSTVDVFVPSIKEQRDIVKKMEAIRQNKEDLQLMKEKLSELFESTLNKAMKGELIN